MATFEFKLPDIGEGVMEGEIVKWLVKPGDEVSEDQGLVEVMRALGKYWFEIVELPDGSGAS